MTENAPTREVVIYHQPSCPVCDQEMEFLTQRDIEFIRKNIRTDLDAMQDMVRMNSQETPTTVIDGETVIIGFDREKLSEELGL